ncbi:MAG: hypothetical protein JWQ48_2231 [Conexibacter sp.]|jgi:hypothetical protein|nr:hypothetical protein [Conexibacter sp.]
MADGAQGMLAFLGVPADPRLLDQDLANLPAAEQHREPAISTRQHDRLVAAGSLLTGITLIGGVALALYGGWQLLFHGGGAFDGVVAAIGVLLASTHWGWVHVAEYIGLTIDDRQERAVEERRRSWLTTLGPYPRFSVTTSVLDDASTRIERVLHQPVLTPQHTFTFVRKTDAATTYDADAPVEDIAATVETMRRQARLETDRLRELWEAASTTYAAALLDAHDDQQRLAAERAAAIALSDHINASLLEPPVVE